MHARHPHTLHDNASILELSIRFLSCRNTDAEEAKLRQNIYKPRLEEGAMPIEARNSYIGGIFRWMRMQGRCTTRLIHLTSIGLKSL